jgi:hypothetical protein
VRRAECAQTTRLLWVSGTRLAGFALEHQFVEWVPSQKRFVLGSSAAIQYDGVIRWRGPSVDDPLYCEASYDQTGFVLLGLMFVSLLMPRPSVGRPLIRPRALFLTRTGVGRCEGRITADGPLVRCRGGSVGHE